jgi:hypothetical protein
MALVVRNSTTGIKTEYSPWEQPAHVILNGKKTIKIMPRMMEIRYLGDDFDTKTEVYGRVCDIRVDALKQTMGIPKLDCSSIRPADMTLLRMFQAACDATPEEDTITDVQRFVLKSRWFRMFDSDGTLLKTDTDTLRKHLRGGTRVDIEYHMNYMRVVGTGEEVPCGNPIVRKITIRVPIKN